VQGRTEGAQGGYYAIGIFRVRADPYVKVLGCADVAMGRQSVRTYDQIFNLPGVEFC